MLSRASFDYFVVRVVPRVERGEFVNAGVVVYCPERRYLAARVRMAEERLLALWPGVDVGAVQAHLRAVERVCAGDGDAGPIARLSQRERFHWLSAARSTVVQPSPVHTGVCAEVDGVLDGLVGRFL